MDNLCNFNFRAGMFSAARKEFIADCRGAIAMVFAIAAVPLIIAAGVAVDFSRAQNLRTELQTAADAAALGAASLVGASVGQRKQAATDYLGQNLSGLHIQPNSSVTVGNDAVVVEVSTVIDNTFMNIVGLAKNPVGASATAVFGTQAGPCILTLEPNGKESLMLNSDSRIDAPDCLVQVNSSDPEALVGNSNGDIVSAETCIKGDWVHDGSSQFSPEPVHCPEANDSLINLPIPAEASDPCDWTDRTVDGTTTLQPGVYCQKLELNSGANVTFAEGIYIIRDGEFIVNANSTAVGDNVMFYLTGTTNNPRFNINSDSHIEFTGRTSGTYAGMVFFQARDAVADFSILNSDSTSIIEGVIYLPNSPLHLNSFGNVSDDSPWTAIITQSLELNSNSVLNVNADYESSSVPVPPGIGGDTGQQIVWLKK